MTKGISVWGLVVGLVIILTKPSQALALACQFNPVGTVLNLGLATNLNLTVVNDGPETAGAVRFVNPNPALFDLRGGSASGWSAGVVGSGVVFSGGSLPAAGQQTFTLQVMGLAETEANYLDAELSADGENFFGCSGGLNISVQAFFQIQNLNISAANTSAVISWWTAEATNARVDYGTSLTYGEYVEDGGLTSQHQVTLTGLQPETQYYFQVTSDDLAGHVAQLGGNGFVTAATTTVINTTTVTETQTVTQTVTGKPVVIVERDVTPPSVKMETDLDKVFTKAPLIAGTAMDGKGVYRVDYSLDGGKNWLPTDELEGAGGKRVKWAFLAMELLDGNYSVKVRATDTANNVGFSDPATMVIDRLPPRVGAAIWVNGAMMVDPAEDGVWYTLAGAEQRIYMSAVGGVTQLELLAEPKEGEEQGQTFSLENETETGLWWGKISFTRPGNYNLTARARDGAGNETKRRLQTVKVASGGKVLGMSGRREKEAELTVYVFNPNTNRFVVWEGKTFWQNNPQLTNQEGEYRLVLPPGKYYLEVRQSGYRLLQTQIFTVDRQTPINADLQLESLPGITWGDRRWLWPIGRPTITQIGLIKPEAREERNLEWGQKLPEITLSTKTGVLYGSDWVGQPTVVSFLSTWSPVASEQMAGLEKLAKMGGVKVVPIFEQETQSAVDLFVKRGGYDLPVWVDEDGVLGEELELGTVPIHWLLDSKGMIKAARTGYLTSEAAMRGGFFGIQGQEE